MTSHADRTSPVVRGKWILDNMLGCAAAAAAGQRAAAQRERRTRWQSLTDAGAHGSAPQNPVCANCHKLMDPIGLAMENFDAVGALADA